MKLNYEREMGEWTDATASELGATWRSVVQAERPSWRPGSAPMRHPKADDRVVWVMTADEATLLLQILRKGSAE